MAALIWFERRKGRPHASNYEESFIPIRGTCLEVATVGSGSRLTDPKNRQPVSVPWRRSMSFRLALVINLIAVSVVVVFWAIDYRREQSTRLAELADRLLEEAKVVRLAEQAFADASGFHRFIEGYCSQMQPTVSPDHHIIVTNEDGHVTEGMMAGRPDGLDRAMLKLPVASTTVFEHTGKRFMMATQPRGSGGTIAVAQSLAPVKRLIRRQAVSRAGSMAALVVLILIAINVLLLRWLRRPIDKLVAGVGKIGQGQFDARIEPLRSPEMAVLAEGINRMAHSLDRSERTRQLEMAKARTIHRNLLPSSCLRIPGLSMDAKYISADSVGGDYHDALELPDGQWLMIVADVCGHGLSAALVTAMLKAEFRLCVRQGLSNPGAIARIINVELECLLGAGHFVTCLLGLYDPTASSFEYVNCGHEPGIFLDSLGRAKATLDGSGLPLGVCADADWDTRRLHLEAGDRLCLFTDGLPESSAPDGVLFGRSRLLDTLRATVGDAPVSQIHAVLAQVAAFQQGSAFLDDVTMVIFQRESQANVWMPEDTGEPVPAQKNGHAQLDSPTHRASVRSR